MNHLLPQKSMLLRLAYALVFLTVLSYVTARAQTPDIPVIKVASPLGVLQNASTKITLRGLKLDDVKEVKCGEGKCTVKIIGQGNANVPNMQDAKKVGDRQVEIELTVPADAPAGELGLTVVTLKGESAPFQLYVGGEFPVVEEKEGNDGFRQAQAISLPQIVFGSIHGDRNVDCFAFEAATGQRITCEVFADRRGGNLDALLSIYSERGILIASHDDLPDSRDARIETTLPSAGKYFLVLQDAHDLGGQAHAYRLVVQPH